MRSWSWGALGLALAAACGGPAHSGGSPNSDAGANVTLTIGVSGQGSVSAPAQSIACVANCAQLLPVGTQVQLVATPGAGMHFAGWSGACFGSGGCALALAKDTQIGAAFAPAPRAMMLLTVDLVGGGQGRVISSPSGIDCPGACAMSVAEGTPVILSAIATTTSRFDGFGGGCSGLTCAFTASADRIVYTSFSVVPTPPDPCAGLLPKLPPSKTFVSPGNWIDGSCGTATTDGLGTVYNVGYGNGSAIYSNAGGTVGYENLFVPLASGFSAFTRGMISTGRYSVFAPDGTLVSTTGYYTPIAAGEQANGGSVIVSVNPGANCDPSNDLEIVRFDDHFVKTSEVHVSNRGCSPGYGHGEPAGVLVDAQDRTLVVYVAERGDVLGIPISHYGGRWFDAAGRPLTEWFDAGPVDASIGYIITPLVSGGAALRSLRSGDWVTLPSGAAQVSPAPAGFTGRADARIVLGGRAYAMAGTTAGTIDIVEPAGKSCGSLAIGNGSYTIGKDGTLLTLVNTVGPSGRLDTCTTTYYPQVLR